MLRIDVESEAEGRVVAMSTATLEQGRAMAKVRHPEIAWDDIPWDGVGTPIEVDESLTLGHVVYRQPVAGLRKIDVGSGGGEQHAGGESERRISLGFERDGVSDPEAGGDAGRSGGSVQGAAHDPVAREEGQGAQARLERPVCSSCWMDSHGCVRNRKCGCYICREEEERNMLGMPYNTVDRDVQDWQRIEEAVAFRLPEGDELFIVRKVACPTCGKPVAMVLAEGTTIGYARRHAQCGLNETEEAEQDNG